MVVTSRARKWPSISAVLSIYLSYLRCKMNGASLARHVLESHRACGCFAVHTRVHNHGFFLPNVAHRSGRCRLGSVGHHVRPDATGSGKPLLPIFAGQRARMAEVIVELVAGDPVRVVRNTFSILAFDAEGRIDLGRFEKQQFALVESVVSPVFRVFDQSRDQTVVDSTSRFIAQGGRWVPSAALARAIEEAALGQRRCRRL